MTKIVITEKLKRELISFLEEQKKPELVETFLIFLEKQYGIQSVLYPKDKMIYQCADDVVKILEADNKICHETEIKITFGERSVDEQTRRIYICPFTGKVFGDNTHPNPQDAIYDWVSKCPENTERVNGMRVKRFYVSEDSEVIKSYIPKTKPKDPVSKVVYSSALSGKLFNSHAAVIRDFKKSYLKPMSLVEVQNQNRFDIEQNFLQFLQDQLTEEKITAFVEAMADHKELTPFVSLWVETEEE